MEWFVAFEEHLGGFVVVAFFVFCVNACGPGGEGAVHVDGDVRHGVAFVDFAEEVDEVLGAADAEGGDDETGAFGVDVFDDFFEFGLDVGFGRVEAVAVGGFGDEPVDVMDHGGVAEDGHVVAAHVAGEKEAFFLFEEVYGDEGGTEDVAGVMKGGDDSGEEFYFAFVRGWGEACHDWVNVVRGVEWLEQVFALLGAFFVDVFDVFYLDVGRVAEHDVAEVNGGWGGEDVAAEAVFHECGDVAAVVYVRVREEEFVDGGGVEGEVAVAFECFFAVALHEAAVEEDSGVVDFEEVHGAGGSLRGAVEGEFDHLALRG